MKKKCREIRVNGFSEMCEVFDQLVKTNTYSQYMIDNINKYKHESGMVEDETIKHKILVCLQYWRNLPHVITRFEKLMDSIADSTIIIPKKKNKTIQDYAARMSKQVNEFKKLPRLIDTITMRSSSEIHKKILIIFLADTMEIDTLTSEFFKMLKTIHDKKVQMTDAEVVAIINQILSIQFDASNYDEYYMVISGPIKDFVSKHISNIDIEHMFTEVVEKIKGIQIYIDSQYPLYKAISRLSIFMMKHILTIIKQHLEGHDIAELFVILRYELDILNKMFYKERGHTTKILSLSADSKTGGGGLRKKTAVPDSLQKVNDAQQKYRLKQAELIDLFTTESNEQFRQIIKKKKSAKRRKPKSTGAVAVAHKDAPSQTGGAAIPILTQANKDLVQIKNKLSDLLQVAAAINDQRDLDLGFYSHINDERKTPALNQILIRRKTTNYDGLIGFIKDLRVFSTIFERALSMECDAVCIVDGMNILHIMHPSSKYTDIVADITERSGQMIQQMRHHPKIRQRFDLESRRKILWVIVRQADDFIFEFIEPDHYIVGIPCKDNDDDCHKDIEHPDNPMDDLFALNLYRYIMLMRRIIFKHYRDKKAEILDEMNAYVQQLSRRHEQLAKTSQRLSGEQLRLRKQIHKNFQQIIRDKKKYSLPMPYMLTLDEGYDHEYTPSTANQTLLMRKLQQHPTI